MRIPERDERGLSESLQFAVIWPVLLLLTLGVIEAGIWLHGRNVAQRSVTAAVDAARGSAGSTAAAQELGLDLARSAGLRDVALVVDRGGTSVTATMTARAPLVLDLGLARLQESASAPLERTTTP